MGADPEPIAPADRWAEDNAGAVDLFAGYVGKALITADFEQIVAGSFDGAPAQAHFALIADLVYGVKASHRDPAKFSFAHGGKDGVPYPVDRPTYDQSIEVLREAVNRAKLADREKLEAIKRLAWYEKSG